MDSLNKLTQIFSDFPGIGPRQAQRFAYFLLTKPSSYRKQIINEIEHLGKDIGICNSCSRYYVQKSTTHKTCAICANNNRDRKLLMVVSRDVDLDAVERTGAYNGLYFVLGGSIPVMDKEPERRVRKQELIQLVTNRAENEGLQEIIFAMNANPEGDHTADFLKQALSTLSKKYNFKISILGRGLSTGTELEYSDSDTLEHALKNRE